MVSTHLGVENPKQALEISAKDIARERNAVKSITRGVIAEKRTQVLLSAPQLTSQFGSLRRFVPPQRERRKGCENCDLSEAKAKGAIPGHRADAASAWSFS